MKKQILYDDLKEYWNKNPDKFLEDYFGIKLFSYQRLILKMIWRRNKRK